MFVWISHYCYCACECSSVLSAWGWVCACAYILFLIIHCHCYICAWGCLPSECLYASPLCFNCRSDVLGHVLPYIGKDWAQSGVTQLFNAISENGYQFIYLSARAIGQFKVTKDYLRSIRQGDICLPDGPLLLDPSSLLTALHRLV